VRIHGIHLQGIRAPRGEHKIAFDPGYNVVVASETGEAHAFIRLLRALIHPARDLSGCARWVAPSGGPARAVLSFTFGEGGYRVILDFERARVLLARYDAEAKRYDRIAADPDGIAEMLSGLGLPHAADFAALNVCDPVAPRSDEATERTVPNPQPVQATPTPAPPALEAAVAGDVRSQVFARVQILRSGRDRYVALEAEQKRIAAELEKRTGLLDLLDNLDERLERFREHSATRTQELSGVEAARRTLVEERGRLRAVPAAQLMGMWLGVGLGAAGALAGTLVQPWFYALAAIGGGAALFGLGVARNARRRMGRVEARMAALRVREASVERRFESETAPIRTLLQSLGLESVDEIQGAGADFRNLQGQSDAVRRDLEEARAAFPEEAEAELRELEQRLTERPEVPTHAAPPPPEPAPSTDEVATPIDFTEDQAGYDALDELLHAAERASGRPEVALLECLTPVLPIYLRALSGGSYTRAWCQPGDDWYFRREGQSERVPFRSAPAEERTRLALAFRFALLEALAPGLGLPVLVGPELMPGVELSAAEQSTAARALRRLAGATQIVHCVVGDGPFADESTSVYTLSA
jgi:hypothetical protein